MRSSKNYVYFFSADGSKGNANMKDILGGKGANLAEMCNLGIPVPPGFTISTEACLEFYKNNSTFSKELKEGVEKSVKEVEKVIGRGFGDAKNPLLLSVRSGARVSMPGMMDTVLNLGLNDEITEGLSQLSGNPRFAWDSYRRFIQMYGDVVLGLKGGDYETDPFEEIIENKKNMLGIENDIDLKTGDLQSIVVDFKKAIQRRGKKFPENPIDQLWGAIGAVFNSWNNERAIKYRKVNNIPHDWGTAVTVQAMVYGNMGNDSATGVAFTRNPSTGENKFYGEYLINAQGEDVVAGIRTPQPINKANKKNKDDVTLDSVMPNAYMQLVEIRNTLENHYRDMQDIEFTIEKGKLYMLQTRTGKRTSEAALRIAVEMVSEGKINQDEAILRVLPDQLEQLLHPKFDDKASREVVAHGLPASPGAATGKVVFSAKEAEKWVEDGEKVILVRIETSPEDIGGMNAAEGILTARGGMTSHAAVVARGMGKCCVAGCKDIAIMYSAKQFRVGKKIVEEGDWISLDGGTGEVIIGKVPTVMPEISGNLSKLLTWSDRVKRLEVRTNADTPHDASKAREFGAKGIGLCRTEHMFFNDNRIKVVREMIMSDDDHSRKVAIEKLLSMQIEDFVEIFEAMEGLPVTIRTIDPPLHEFLPNRSELNDRLSSMKMNLKKAKNLNDIDLMLKDINKDQAVLDKVDALTEINPMLGLRGCRLGILFPELTEMQAKAIFEAAYECKRKGIHAKPEIMIPLVSCPGELEDQKAIVEKAAKAVMDRHVVEIEYKIGTMIELPRAALIADQLSKTLDFFSFGTNDLTQTTMGLSRDDAGRFLPLYLEKGIFPADPFRKIDVEGVGSLVEMAVKKARATHADMELGVCGEHGGDPSSVEFFHKIGLDYVSCSPFRVPVARLAAAQVALKERSKELKKMEMVLDEVK